MIIGVAPTFRFDGKRERYALELEGRPGAPLPLKLLPILEELGAVVPLPGRLPTPVTPLDISSSGLPRPLLPPLLGVSARLVGR